MDDHWFELPSGGDLRRPGVYQWWVDGRPIYTGKAVEPYKRLRQYVSNVRRLRQGDHYRRNNPSGFRAVHHRLHSAIAVRARIEFRIVENCAAEALNARERHHQRLMTMHAPLTDLRSRFAAECDIVQAVLAKEQPPERAVRLWLRGGAVFWNEDHFALSWGLLLREAVTREEIDSLGIRLAIQEADDLCRFRFGSIPVRDLHGNAVLAVSWWNGFLGDRLFGFFSNIDHFRAAASADSWLLAKEHDMADALAELTDDQLLSLWCSRSMND
jgi:hypothetical protein